ncbi:MAG: tRNA (N6-isopentenyl adenosine(37)-C2)-methylthiotransferase MiaB [Treponema sp.]|jgi:tRNA-2-methylthio-N6-dimethylallyladenosine synthase|nr:tRNA (N6-isopentenyl adenosine(37)-C2)-methylthiotransferase MiaB [Treponema sp.]
MTYFFETYGCQMNSAESAALDLVCRERGWTPAADGAAADLVLLNTCSVRRTAETRVMGRLAWYAALKKKRKPGQDEVCLVVAGCMAERLGETIKKSCPAVDYVMGTSARSIFPLILEALEKRRMGEGTGFPLPVGEKPVFAFSSSHLEEGQFRSFVPIMHGCNNFCSYCVVPYVRGPEISRDPASILGEIRFLEKHGVREITLLGQNVNSYRWEGPLPAAASGAVLGFSGLLRLVAQEVAGGSIRWVRFLSANPKDLSPETIAVMSEYPVFCRHLHLPVQHGSNSILAAMNRRYTREQYLDLVRSIRSAMPGISLSTDILVGFPGETAGDLEETLRLMAETKFLYAYMYHFNPREGTAACGLPGRIDEGLKRERLGRVIALQKEHTQELLKNRLGQRTNALVEGISRKNADEIVARTERDEMVVAPGTVSLAGHFVELTLSGLRGNTFRAKEIRVCPGDS